MTDQGQNDPVRCFPIYFFLYCKNLQQKLNTSCILFCQLKNSYSAEKAYIDIKKELKKNCKQMLVRIVNYILQKFSKIT